MPGSGKTTIAKPLAEALEFPLEILPCRLEE
jgi:adenylate kinase family enzyme